MTSAAKIDRVEELPLSGDLPLWTHPSWQAEYPWLVQATTGAGSEVDPFDLGLSGDGPIDAVLSRWRAVRSALGSGTIVCSRQVHGTEIAVQHPLPVDGTVILEGLDGHATAAHGVALAVTVADCVPVFLLDPVHRSIALLHAGWRGIAGGILERGVDVLCTTFQADTADLVIHFGPSICGDCYEVGPEVIDAVRADETGSKDGRHVDLALVLGGRAIDLGVSPDRITASSHCTRCSRRESRFFSYRGGDSARQVAVLAIRPD